MVERRREQAAEVVEWRLEQAAEEGDDGVPQETLIESELPKSLWAGSRPAIDSELP